MNICKECKHYLRDMWYDKYCMRDAIPSLNRVTGFKEYSNIKPFHIERYEQGLLSKIFFGKKDRCGPEGKYWEPK